MSESLLLVSLVVTYIGVGLLTFWIWSERREPNATRFLQRSVVGDWPVNAIRRVEAAQLSGSRVDQAVCCFTQGCPCSRALLAAYGPALGITRGEALEAGLWLVHQLNVTETCGAVTGALTILVQRFPGADLTLPKGRATALAATRAFSGRFAAGHGSLLCRQLLEGQPPGIDQLIQSENIEAAGFRPCSGLIRDAARIVEDLLKNGLGAPAPPGLDKTQCLPRNN